jgi:hypothetical protein
MKTFLLALAAFALANQAFAMPAQVIITRHGEKPASGNELNIQGCERAYSLPNFFQPDNSAVWAYGKPAAIYAMQPDSDDGSVRPIQTIAPTADRLGLTINDTYTRLQYQPIVAEIMQGYDGQTVLISWEHKAIPGLAQAFGVTLDKDTKKWPGAVFDEAWVIGFQGSKKGDAKATLQIIPESVLPTDNPLGGADWGNGPTQGNGTTVPADIVSECQNNDSLNGLVKKWVNPALPDPSSNQ